MCMYVHLMCTWCPQSTEECVSGPQELKILMVVNHCVGARQLNQGPLQEHRVLSTIESSLQHPAFTFLFNQQAIFLYLFSP